MSLLASLSRKILHGHWSLDHRTLQYATQDCQCQLRVRKQKAIREIIVLRLQQCTSITVAWISNPSLLNYAKLKSFSKESPYNAGDPGLIPGSGRSQEEPLYPDTRRPVFLPGKFCEEKSVMGYRPRDCKESDRTERLTLPHFHSLTSFHLAYHFMVTSRYDTRHLQWANLLAYKTVIKA